MACICKLNPDTAIGMNLWGGYLDGTTKKKEEIFRKEF